MEHQFQKLSFTDRIVLLISVAVVIGTLSISNKIFEQIPHIEDEFTYAWQAEVAARGEISTPIPACPRCFLVPFVVDYNGQRFGKYQLPWPVLLSFGVRLGVRKMVNPILAGACIGLIYLLVKKLRDKRTGLIAAILLATSPFFLINASTLLSHVFSLFLTLVFVISWLDAATEKKDIPGWLPISTAGLSLALLILSRPLTALGITVPFVLHGLFLLVRGSRRQKIAVLSIGLIAIVLMPVHFLWQYALTGDPLKNPYTIVWPYDTIGFGPGIGRQTGGYQLRMAIGNARSGLYVGMFDLFGWLKYSWILLPVGLIAVIRDWRSLLVGSTAITVVAAYALYWIGSDLFGPRYYYEALPACILLTAAAISWMAGLPEKITGLPFWKSLQTWRFVLVSLVSVFFVVCSLYYYLPSRLPRFYGLYGANATRLLPFINMNKPGITPALVIVHITKSWTDYSTLTELSNPYFDTPYVFSLSKGEKSDAIAAGMFPGRYVWHYYPDEPYVLRAAPR